MNNAWDGIIQAFNDHSIKLAFVGAAFCSYKLLKIVQHVSRAIRSFFLAPLLNLGLDPLKLGSWAVVTGSTDGIGKAYAMALAKKGMNIVLVSRSASKLAAVADEIAAATNVQTKCITVDFSGGTEIYPAIEEELEGIDVGILVNNVGIISEYPEYFHDLPNRDQAYRNLLHVNTFSVTFMTSIVVPRMVAKHKGAVVNVGSGLGFGCPLFSVYSASKAYMHSFTQNLAVEYKDKGIICQSLYPNLVDTKAAQVAPSYTTPSPERYANSALATLGIESETTGCFLHWMEELLFRYLLPPWAARKLWFMVFSGVRADVLKKRAAKKD